VKLLVLIFLTFGFSNSAFSKEIKCVDTQETSQIRSITNFSSTLPVLWNDIALLNTDGTVRSRKRNTYVSAGIACGVLVDFKTECTTKEKENALGYQFSFTCPQKKISGSFYVDETGFGQFQCSTPNLPQTNMIAYECHSEKSESLGLNIKEP